MKKIIFTSCLVLLAIVMQSCVGSSSFVNPTFYQKTMDHRIIAVLPFEMIFTGKQPKKLTPHQVKKIEEIESLAFQESLYHLLSDQCADSRDPVRIDIQPLRETNRLLEEHRIGIRESWYMDPGELARLLRVDAVVRTRVEKKRYMSDLASLGIELGSVILNYILDDDFPIALFLRVPTSTIRADCSLYNGRDGTVLWGIRLVDDTDWRKPANEIIHHINYYFAQRFPYR